jgi:hypothetical protein
MENRDIWLLMRLFSTSPWSNELETTRQAYDLRYLDLPGH